jgi:hypothetical protein
MKDKKELQNYVSVGDVKMTLTKSPLPGAYEYTISDSVLDEIEKEKMNKKKFEYEEDKRRSFFASVKQIGGFPIDESDFVEVTEWSNMEGVDVNLQHNEMGGRIFQMTYQEWQVLKKLMKKLTS